MKFKTSLKCGGCVNSIRPYLEKIKEIKSWEVDLNSPEKILTVQVDKDSDELKNTIISSFKQAGYNAELL